jgi:uncharacterized protein YqgC (DUF456 family)
MRAIIRIGSGILLILIGLVGLLMPIMPGWLFIIPGLVILAEYFHPIRRLVDWAKRVAIRSGAWREPTPAAERNCGDRPEGL